MSGVPEMKTYSSRLEFREAVRASIRKNGFQQKWIDGARVQALCDYRKAAAFVVAVLSVIEISDGRYIKEVLAECEAVLVDDVVYVLDGEGADEVESKMLKNSVSRAQEAIAHAGNICNNFMPGTMPERIHEVVLRARNICDEAIKINSVIG